MLDSNIAIKVEGLSKRYYIGKKKDGSLRGTLSSLFHASHQSKDEFWALKEVSFEVKKGDVVGIIGKNGAGKSTLLKILSQITRPTEGKISINGRIASLLEVGTGFHPELTGRENIYLNGTILGMTRKEVKARFHEIVAFSGIEKFIDTPVKHYSSGQYVRLAFSVAAHLEPEILVIDEVLAVGDAEFQKKCLGKMKDVAGEGRTVLFVSHNMEAVKNLCTRAIFLEKGKLKMDGVPNEIINKYLERFSNSQQSIEFDKIDAPGNDIVKLKSASISPNRKDQKNIITVKSPLLINIDFWIETDSLNTNLSLQLFSGTGECVLNTITQMPVPTLTKGLHHAKLSIPGDLLNTGLFAISIMVVKDATLTIFNFEEVLSFEVEEEREKMDYHGKFTGFIRPILDFKITT